MRRMEGLKCYFPGGITEQVRKHLNSSSFPKSAARLPLSLLPLGSGKRQVQAVSSHRAGCPLVSSSQTPTWALKLPFFSPAPKSMRVLCKLPSSQPKCWWPMQCVNRMQREWHLRRCCKQLPESHHAVKTATPLAATVPWPVSVDLLRPEFFKAFFAGY